MMDNIRKHERLTIVLMGALIGYGIYYIACLVIHAMNLTAFEGPIQAVVIVGAILIGVGYCREFADLIKTKIRP
ncbi:MAG: hypothetical protein Q3972_08040 [Corynebacterium sp.]|nr:hypothetical protein [Corynebacterium sp.]